MIILTVHTGANTTDYTFDQDKVIIGNGESQADIRLPSPFLQAEHITIIRKEGRWVVINSASDPTATLDGHPFKEERLLEGHCLRIGGSEIQLQATNKTPVAVSKDLDFDVDEELRKLGDVLSAEGEGEKSINQAEVANIDIDALLREVGMGGETAAWHPPQNPIEDKNPKITATHDDDDIVFRALHPNEQENLELLNINKSLADDSETERSPARHKDSDYSAYEDDEDITDASFAKGEAPSEYHEAAHTRAWMTSNRFIAIAVILLAMTGVLGAGAYIAISNRNQEQERNAAQGVSDIAMALFHARMTGQTPPHENWTDEDFLEENLQAVLSSKYRARGNVDCHMHFINCPYRLRIAFDPTNSTYMVAALPNPGPLQWIIPKYALFIDSSSMTLRETYSTSDIDKALTSLETGTDPDHAHLSALKANAKLISLEFLNEQAPHQGFAPPAELSTLIPGAENHIYNAPRYYKLSRSIIETAAQISDKGDDYQSQARLADLLALFQRYPDWIFYCSQGREMALQAFRGLKIFAPNENFSVAYLSFNSDDGLIADSHLLQDSSDKQLIAPSHIATPSVQTNVTPTANVDHEHPLYLSLSQLAQEREAALQPISEEIVRLMDSQNKQDSQDFISKHQQLLTKYTQIEEQQKNKISATLTYLYHQYAELNPSQPAINFLAYVQATGLSSYLPNGIADAPKSVVESSGSLRNMNLVLNKIRAAEDFTQLDDAVTSAANLMSSENITDLQDRMAFEDNLRTAALIKLNEFLKARPSYAAEQGDRRQIINRIFNNAGISQEEEREYYLKQFDHLYGNLNAATEKGRDPSDRRQSTPQRPSRDVGDGNNRSQDPSAKAAAKTSEEKRTSARLGEQILIRTRTQPPTAQRDTDLTQAISFLMKVKGDDYRVWQSILEARNLLTQGPEDRLKDLLKGDLTFGSDKHSLTYRIVTATEAFADAMSKGKNVLEDPAQLKAVLTVQSESLTTALKDAVDLQAKAHVLADEYEAYVKALDAYAHDYEEAKEAGFFPTNPRFHINALAQVNRKLKALKEAQTKLFQVADILYLNGTAYETLLKAESNRIATENTAASAADAATLLRKVTRVSYPTTSMEELNTKFEKIFKIDTNPIPPS